MPLRTRRPAALVLLALLAGGCGGQSDTPAAGSAATSTTAATTTTTVPGLDAQERAWLKAVSDMDTKVQRSFRAGSVAMTRAKMLQSGNMLAAWSGQLRRIGAPSDRLEPASIIVRKVVATFARGARCFARAARVSSPAARWSPAPPRNGSSARPWSAASPPRATAPTCSATPTGGPTSSRPSTADDQRPPD
jgi:hypothetical protein